MIINPVKNKPYTSWPGRRNDNTLSYARVVLFIEKSFSWTDIEDVNNEQTWSDAIDNRDIIPLFNVNDSRDVSDELKFITSSQLNEYPEIKGKIKFEFDFLIDPMLHQAYDQYSLQDYDFAYIDINNNLVLQFNENGTYSGFQTELILMNKQKSGLNGAELAYSTLIIHLFEWMFDTARRILCFPFKVSKLKKIPVTFYEVEAVSDTIQFLILDSQFDQPILGLLANNFKVIDDVSGAILPYSFFKNDKGKYQLNYKGEGATYSTYVPINAGGDGTTDWESSGNIPDFYTDKDEATGKIEILSGGDFQGRYLRFSVDQGTQGVSFITTDIPGLKRAQLDDQEQYVLHCRLKTNDDTGRFVLSQYTEGGLFSEIGTCDLPDTLGITSDFSIPITLAQVPVELLVMDGISVYFNINSAEKYLEIDNVSITGKFTDDNKISNGSITIVDSAYNGSTTY